MQRYLAIYLLLISFSAYGSKIKCVDAEGNVSYTDTPSPACVKTKILRDSSAASDSVTSSSGVAAPKTVAEREADWKKTQQAKSETEQKTAKAQEDAANKKKNCDSARESLATLENAPRLVTYDTQGEQSFLDDDARQQRIAEARKAISSSCN